MATANPNAGWEASDGMTQFTYRRGARAARAPLFSAAAVAAVALATGAASAQEELHVYNWSDYIGEDTIANFEEEFGIDVIYDVYDTNEIVEAKLLAGNSGYDIVVPTAMPFLARLIMAEALQPLDKSQIPNLDNLDPDLDGAGGDRPIRATSTPRSTSGEPTGSASMSTWSRSGWARCLPAGT